MKKLEIEVTVIYGTDKEATDEAYLNAFKTILFQDMENNNND